MVASDLTITNSTPKDLKIEVSEVVNFDFWRANGWPMDLNNLKLRAHTAVSKPIEMYTWAVNCPFRMVLKFDDGSYDDFKICQKWAMPDRFDVLRPEDKTLNNQGDLYCIHKLFNSYAWVAMIEGMLACPHLEVNHKTHDIRFIRKDEGNSKFSIEIKIEQTAAMLSLTQAKDKDKEATKYYNSTKDRKKDLDQAISSQQAAVDLLQKDSSELEKLLAKNEFEKLLAKYKSKLTTYEAEKQAINQSPADNIAAMAEHKKALDAQIRQLKGMDNSASSKETDPVMTQLQIKANAIQAHAKGLENENKGKDLVKDMAKGDELNLDKISDVVKAYRDAVRSYEESLKCYNDYESFSNNENSNKKQLKKQHEGANLALKKALQIQLVAAVKKLQLGGEAKSMEWNGQNELEKNAQLEKAPQELYKNLLG